MFWQRYEKQSVIYFENGAVISKVNEDIGLEDIKLQGVLVWKWDFEFVVEVKLKSKFLTRESGRLPQQNFHRLIISNSTDA